MTREEIKKYLLDGDGVRIALRCCAKGVKTDGHYVMMVVNTRKALRGISKVILEEAEIVASENKILIEKAQENDKQ